MKQQVAGNHHWSTQRKAANVVTWVEWGESGWKENRTVRQKETGCQSTSGDGLTNETRRRQVLVQGGFERGEKGRRKGFVHILVRWGGNTRLRDRDPLKAI